MHLTRNVWFAVLLAVCLPAGAIVPGSYLRSYLSAVDGSVQPYGLYVPTSYRDGVPAPVAFNGHGFGGHAGGSFSAPVMAFADTNGFLLVQLDGRGNTFYDGLGETDMREVLQDMRTYLSVDATRLYFEGASMGATGAYRQGIRHPDLLAASGGADGFADYREWYAHWYGPRNAPNTLEPFRLPNLLMASCVDVAEGAAWHQMYLVTDTGDTTVPSVNAYNLDARLTALDGQTPETDYLHELHAYPGGHTANYNQLTLCASFLGKSQVAKPAHVVEKTTRLKYGAMHWVTIDRLLRVNEFARVDARAAGNAVAITAENVRELTLRLDDSPVHPAQPAAVTINGVAAYTGAAQTVTLYAVLSAAGAVIGWTTTDRSPRTRSLTSRRFLHKGQ